EENKEPSSDIAADVKKETGKANKEARDAENTTGDASSSVKESSDKETSLKESSVKDEKTVSRGKVTSRTYQGAKTRSTENRESPSHSAGPERTYRTKQKFEGDRPSQPGSQTVSRSYTPRTGSQNQRQGTSQGYGQQRTDQPPRYNSQSRPGTSQQRFGSSPQRPGSTPRYGSNGSQGGGQRFTPGGPRSFDNRRPGGGPPRFGTSGPRPGGKDDSKGESSASKTPAKKFFKAKKKTVYQKTKREHDLEKNFQVKKKLIQKVNPVPKEIDIMEVITVSELAKKMNLKASELISRFMSMGMMVSINQQIDAETVEIIASEYGCKVNIVSLYDETIVDTEKGDDSDIIERPPVVTVMGHVDHGKTKLLDAIRSTDIAASEHGGITQHIGAYKVRSGDRSIVFLDTPGHEAFTLMRARGAQLTDIVVLVVAANDGVMPQTIEAINHAKEAEVPIIVAINKIDVVEANVDRVKHQLSTYDLIPEDWGGSTIFCEISALKKIGIENLLENILIQSDVLELKANPNCRAEGKIIESRIDHGRGIVSTILIERGTLNVGDAFIAGVYSGKVRAIFNDRGAKIETAPPSTPIEIIGSTGMPNAGDPFQVTDSEKTARMIGSKRQELEKIGVAKNVKKVTLDNLYDSISEGSIQELKAIIKGDVQGSVEALKIALEKLSTPEIRLNVIHSSAGAIVENDVNLASASNAIIVGFHVRPTAKAQILAEQEKVEIRKYTIIYDAVEDIKTAMEGLLAPDLKEVALGTAEVRDVFKVPKIGAIAGCYVTSGKVRRNSVVHLFREGIEIFSGKISSLKRFKDDVKEVEKNYECGIGLENFNDIKAGDIIEVYEMKEIYKKLEG
ncbi:MAG: translation initiation factor IF-2, partial [Spirochaetia bacterium]|nr:translation initiation factor IF-2 [Spirochaetia bacterium]